MPRERVAERGRDHGCRSLERFTAGRRDDGVRHAPVGDAHKYVLEVTKSAAQASEVVRAAWSKYRGKDNPDLRLLDLEIDSDVGAPDLHLGVTLPSSGAHGYELELQGVFPFVLACMGGLADLVVSVLGFARRSLGRGRLVVG